MLSVVHCFYVTQLAAVLLETSVRIAAVNIRPCLLQPNCNFISISELTQWKVTYCK